MGVIPLELRRSSPGESFEGTHLPDHFLSMIHQPTSRQELYDRIRESSKDEVIIEEMIRLGFWPLQGSLPVDPADEIRKRSTLEAELRALRTENTRLRNVEALKREARKRRMAESRQRQKDTKENRLQQRQERAQAWQQQQARQITYLGKGVSAGLSNADGDANRLQTLGLPLLHTALDLAQAMDVSVSELRFLAFSRATAVVSHYVQFHVPKKSGGQRLISAPLPRLKKAQSWILQNVLDTQAVHPAAHGFVRGRSIVSNARPHVQADIVVNVDLKDYFPTVSYARVKGLFRSLGYSEALATVFGLLCTEPRRQALRLDGREYHVAVDERVLPQGAPTSPAITNLMCRGLDQRFVAASKTLGFAYTRYADDLSFSGPGSSDVGKLLRQVHYIVAGEGFVVHPDKTRVFRKPWRQEVTGIVVNERPAIQRSTLKRFRATLFQIDKDGPGGKTWGNSPDVIAAVEGFANYVAMVDPAKGKPLQDKARSLVRRYGKKEVPQPKRQKRTSPCAASKSASKTMPDNADQDQKPWWKIW